MPRCWNSVHVSILILVHTHFRLWMGWGDTRSCACICILMEHGLQYPPVGWQEVRPRNTGTSRGGNIRLQLGKFALIVLLVKVVEVCRFLSEWKRNWRQPGQYGSRCIYQDNSKHLIRPLFASAILLQTLLLFSPVQPSWLPSQALNNFGFWNPIFSCSWLDSTPPKARNHHLEHHQCGWGKAGFKHDGNGSKSGNGGPKRRDFHQHGASPKTPKNTHFVRVFVRKNTPLWWIFTPLVRVGFPSTCKTRVLYGFSTYLARTFVYGSWSG